MRTLQPNNRLRIGLMFIALMVLVVAVGQTFTAAPMLFGTPSYKAEFTDSGGINEGDDVRIAGIDVGKVKDLKIDGDHLEITYSIGPNTMGTESRAGIKTDTILGKKVLDIEPRGANRLNPGGTLPIGQTTTPYQIFDAFFDISQAAEGWDINTVKRSLKVLTQTIDETYPQLNSALDGVAKFSDTIGKRDDEIKNLLVQAKKVAGVIGDRSDQVNRLLVSGNTLLAAFNQRGQAIDALLGNVSAVSTQVQGLIKENPNLHHVLEELSAVSDVLVARKDDLGSALTLLGKFTASLSEAVSSGPYFKVMVANLIPYQILQPYVDAAFKKRGLDPEDFWRSAGLPSFRFPDPNGTRFPNGAPPPAPPILEGTPDHPGPAVVPGSPCSYAPPRDSLPRPENPLPCAGLPQNQGPFGPLAGPYPGLPDVLTSPPNPGGLPPTPGIGVAGRPGQPAPDLPGTPVPLPPEAPPGARSEPPAPVSGPLPANPGAGSPAPALAPGPPPPPGPGPQLPAPFIAPGEGGNSQPGGGGGSLGR